MKQIRYRSRISVLMILFILGIFSIILLDGTDIEENVIILTIPFLFTIAIFATINYTISDDNLIIRTLGFKMGTIDIAQIKSLKRSYNPLSSPAGSLKRLEVKFYHKGRLETALISPIHEGMFVQRLKEMNPSIEANITQSKNVLRFWDWDI